MGTRKRSEIRSLVFTDSVLDYLVHLHVLPSGNRTRSSSHPLIREIPPYNIHDRYRQFCIDAYRTGNDNLKRVFCKQTARCWSDAYATLGLLVGVNDTRKR